MSKENPNGSLAKFRQARDQKFSPECGSQLMEVDRRNENEVLFV